MYIENILSSVLGTIIGILAIFGKIAKFISEKLKCHQSFTFFFRNELAILKKISSY